MSKKNAGGRPKKPKYEIDFMVKKIDEYIAMFKDSTTPPILKECCLMNEWNYDTVMDLQRKNLELYQSTRKLLDWKEVKLEQGLLSGSLVSTGAVFSLKQLGWRDRAVEDVKQEMEERRNALIEALTVVAEGKEDGVK